MNRPKIGDSRDAEPCRRPESNLVSSGFSAFRDSRYRQDAATRERRTSVTSPITSKMQMTT